MRLALVGTVLLICAVAAVPGLPQRSEQEPNNARSQADPLGLVPGSGCRSGAIRPAGDIDYYRIEIATSVLVYLTTDTTGDTVIALQDAQGISIAQDDDSGVGSASQIARFLNPGTYFVAVWEYGKDGVIEDYKLLLSTSGYTVESEANNDIWSADPIGAVPGVVAATGSIEQGDQDWYRFEVWGTAPGHITTVTGGDTVVKLYSASGAILNSNDDSGGGRWSLISGHWLDAGTYFVEVREYGGAAAIDKYLLLVGRSYADASGSNGSQGSSHWIDLETGSGMARGSALTQGTTHWYGFRLESDAMVSVSAYSVDDTKLTLRDAGGSALEENDDVTSGIRWSRIDRYLIAGTYYATVAPFGADPVSAYVLAVVLQ